MARSDLKGSVTVDLKGNLANRSKSYEKALERMGKRGQKHMGLLSRSAYTAGRGIDQLGNRWTALATGVAGAAAVRQVVALDARMKQLQTDGRASADEVIALKKELFAVANDKNIRLDPNLLLGGIEEVIEKTGDKEFARGAMRNIGLVMRATNAEAQDVAAVFSNLYKGGIRDTETMLKVMDALVEQTKTGSVAFRDLAKVGNKLFAPYLSAGKSGAQAIKDMGAVAQITIDAVGSADEATEATKGLLANLKDQKIQKLLEGNGIKVFDGDEMRSLPVLIEEIFTAAGGNISKLSAVFGETGIKVFEGYSLEGNAEKLKQLAALQESGEKVVKSAAINASTAAAAIESLSSTFKILADRNLNGPIQSVADFINNTEQSTKDAVFTAAAGTVSAVIATYVGRKAYGAVFGGRKSSGSALGASGGLASSMKPVPVFVVNKMPGFGKGGGGPFGKTRTPGKWQLLKAAPNMKTIGAMGAGAMGTAGLAVGAAGAGGYAIGTLIKDLAATYNPEGYDRVGEALHKMMAFLGSDDAQSSLDSRRKYEASLRVTVDDERVRVTRVMSDPSFNIDADDGINMP